MKKALLSVVSLLLILTLSSCTFNLFKKGETVYSDSLKQNIYLQNALKYNDCTLTIEKYSNYKQTRVVKTDNNGTKTEIFATDYDIDGITRLEGDDISVLMSDNVTTHTYQSIIINYKTGKKSDASRYKLPENAVVSGYCNGIFSYLHNNAAAAEMADYKTIYCKDGKTILEDYKNVNFTEKYIYYTDESGLLYSNNYELKNQKVAMSKGFVTDYTVNGQYVLFLSSLDNEESIHFFDFKTDKSATVDCKDKCFYLDKAVFDSDYVFVGGSDGLHKINLKDFSSQLIVDSSKSGEVQNFSKIDDYLYICAANYDSSSFNVKYDFRKLSLKDGKQTKLHFYDETKMVDKGYTPDMNKVCVFDQNNIVMVADPQYDEVKRLYAGTVNSGDYCIDGDWIYYCELNGEYASEYNDGDVIKAKLDGTQKQVILNETVGFLKLYKGNLYAVEYSDNALIRFDKNGKNRFLYKATQRDYYESMGGVEFWNDKIIFDNPSGGESIMDLDGSNVKIISHCYSGVRNQYENFIFLTEYENGEAEPALHKDYIYNLKTNTKTQYKFDAEYDSWKCDRNFIYYLYDKKLYSFNVINEKTEFIIQLDNAESICGVVDNKIYFTSRKYSAISLDIETKQIKNYK